jgi:preprotein translocase subunit YajC
MGAIVVSAFVTIVAIVGVIYFNYQDKKEQQRSEIKK